MLYFNGWVQFYPSVIAYCVRDFPAAAQISLYFMVAIAIAVLLQRELQKVLQISHRPFEAAVFSILVLLSVRLLIPAFNQMVWSVWPAILAAGCYILRKNTTQQRYSMLGVTGTAIACLSNPIAVIFIPLLIFFALRGPRGLASANIFLAALILLYYAAFFTLGPTNIILLNADPAAAGAALLSNIASKPASVEGAAMVAAIFLIFVSAIVLIRTETGNPRLTTILGLAYLGLASLALSLASNRFNGLGIIQSRHAMMIVATAELAALLYLADAINRAWRGWIVAASFLTIGLIAAALFRHGIPNVLRNSIQKYSYAVAADGFRAHCEEGTILASQPRNRNLVLLCKRRIIDRGNIVASNDRRPDGFDASGNIVFLEKGAAGAFIPISKARLWNTGETI